MISQHIKSRNPLQVKNHARQFFKKVDQVKGTSSPINERKIKPLSPNGKLPKNIQKKLLKEKESVVVIQNEETNEDIEIDIGGDEPENPTPVVITTPGASNSPTQTPQSTSTRSRISVPVVIEHHIDTKTGEDRAEVKFTGNPQEKEQNGNMSNGDSDSEGDLIDSKQQFDPPTEEKILDEPGLTSRTRI